MAIENENDEDQRCDFDAEPGADGLISGYCLEDRCKWHIKREGHCFALCPHPAACSDEDRCIHPVIGFG